MRTPFNPLGLGGLSTSPVISGGAPSRAVPGAPTIGVAIAGNTTASVTFTPPVSDGGSPITSYTVTSSPGGFTATTPDGATLTANVTGLTNGTLYTFTVTANNAVGASAASSASAAKMPLFFWGVYPAGCASETTPNVDGAISAMADVSLNLYPLSQGTAGDQPIRGSGVITFDGVSDFLGSIAAAFVAFPNNCHAWRVTIIGSLLDDPSAATGTLGGWFSTVSATIYARLVQLNTDRIRGEKRDAITQILAAPVTAMDTAEYVYSVEGDGGTLADTIRVFRDGTQLGTDATNTQANVTHDRFGIGAFFRTTATSFCHLAVRGWVAADRTFTLGERAEIALWKAAGCPTR